MSTYILNHINFTRIHLQLTIHFTIQRPPPLMQWSFSLGGGHGFVMWHHLGVNRWSARWLVGSVVGYERLVVFPGFFPSLQATWSTWKLRIFRKTKTFTFLYGFRYVSAPFKREGGYCEENMHVVFTFYVRKPESWVLVCTVSAFMDDLSWALLQAILNK